VFGVVGVVNREVERWDGEARRIGRERGREEGEGRGRGGEGLKVGVVSGLSGLGGTGVSKVVMSVLLR